ncbi:MAG: glycosyl transferase, family 2 [Hyphomicrobiales bacterium]|nr:glycosyl transferase, family 2 [Hyphomicrobiales bacterium]
MTKLGLVPYPSGDGPAARSVPVSVVVLAKNEAANLGHCLDSVAWAEQVVVVDSGSTDETPTIASSRGAEVVHEPWRGFARQRQFALEMDVLRHSWIYFVDADEWVTSDGAREVAAAITHAEHAAYRQRFRLVFQGRWIRHCGWYSGAWIIRLMRRDQAAYGAGGTFGERPTIAGSIGTLTNDLVDQDRKGLAAWLHKHVDYAVLEAERRGVDLGLRERLQRWPAMRRTDTRPMARAVLKDLVFPAVPAKPLAIFVYMYIVRLGFLDGVVGLRFCVFHAWFQVTVNAVRNSPHRQASSEPGPTT